MRRGIILIEQLKDKNLRLISSLISAGVLFCVSCAQPPEDEADTSSSRYLYVASGACYSGGGNTAFSNTTSSNLVYRINLSTGAKDATIADYNSSPSQA